MADGGADQGLLMRAAMKMDSQVRLPPRQPRSPPQKQLGDAETNVSSATQTAVLYDANESIFSVVLRFKGTLLPMVLSRPLFWL